MVYRSSASTREIKLAFAEIVPYLFREDRFADGVVLLTSLVQDAPFTLPDCDLVETAFDGMGVIFNPVAGGHASATSIAL